MTTPEAPTELEQLVRAARLVIDTQFGSPSMLKRKLFITYDEAARLLGELARYGVVGPPAATRKVLVPCGQLDEVVDQIRGVR